MHRLLCALLFFAPFAHGEDSPADPANYLAAFTQIARTNWPKNRMLTIVAHGHSVPAGYARTPEVRTLDAYPHLLHHALAERFPHAVINVFVTALGGEASETGSQRFERDVLSHKPDVVTIDYALNDRRLGLDRARLAWSAMIEKAQAQKIPVILLTPTPDQSAKLDDPADPLCQHAEQIRALAAKYHTGLVDSFAAFQEYRKSGGELAKVMAQVNHPNRAGHELVLQRLLPWFP